MYILLTYDVSTVTKAGKNASAKSPKPASTTASESRTPSSSAKSIPPASSNSAQNYSPSSTRKPIALEFTILEKTGSKRSSITARTTITTSTPRSSCNGHFAAPRTPSARAIFQHSHKLFDITKFRVRGFQAGNPTRTLPRLLRYRSPRGGRGLKQMFVADNDTVTNRSPRGGRGLKQPTPEQMRQSRQSLPTRGARIETTTSAIDTSAANRSPRGGRGLKPYLAVQEIEGVNRSPRGGRGLKLLASLITLGNTNRSPRGGRGLKPSLTCGRGWLFESLPTRGARIETTL